MRKIKELSHPDFRTEHSRCIVSNARDSEKMMRGFAVQCLQIFHVLVTPCSAARTLEHGRASSVHVIAPASPFILCVLLPLPTTGITNGQPVITGIILSYQIHNV